MPGIVGFVTSENKDIALLNSLKILCHFSDYYVTTHENNVPAWIGTVYRNVSEAGNDIAEDIKQ